MKIKFFLPVLLLDLKFCSLSLKKKKFLFFLYSFCGSVLLSLFLVSQSACVPSHMFMSRFLQEVIWNPLFFFLTFLITENTCESHYMQLPLLLLIYNDVL